MFDAVMIQITDVISIDKMANYPVHDSLTPLGRDGWLPWLVGSAVLLH